MIIYIYYYSMIVSIVLAFMLAALFIRALVKKKHSRVESYPFF